MTAVSVYQATLPVPGRVIPNDAEVEAAVLAGERAFASIGCASCHVPSLPLERSGWIYTEPNPYNPALNLKPGQAPTLRVDLTDEGLPGPRLRPDDRGVVWVPAYTDFKLHDITDPSDPAEAEAIDMNQSLVSPRFREGNRRFLTKRLWGAANEPPYFHHGQYTTLRDAIQALPAAMYVTDVEGRITLFNEAAVELWGRRPQIGVRGQGVGAQVLGGAHAGGREPAGLR